MLMVESLPRALRARVKRSDSEMGVSSISFSPNDETTFLVGSESGGVFKCSTNARGTPARRNALISFYSCTCRFFQLELLVSGELKFSVPLRSAVTFSFDVHGGPVYSIECSPFHRNMFLTCGTDTTARLYSVLQVCTCSSIS